MTAVLAGESPVDLHQRRIAHRLETLAVFDAQDYLALNADLGAIEPRAHYARNGLAEARLAITAERRTAKLARAVAMHPMQRLGPDALRRAYGAAAVLSPSIHLPARAEPAQEALAERLAQALETVGLRSPLRRGRPGEGDRSPILVGAPALFGPAPLDAACLDILRRCMVAMDEAPGEAAFVPLLPLILAAGGVVATEVESFALARAYGLPSVRFGLAPSTLTVARPPDDPLSEGLGRVVRAAPAGLPWAERPIDVLAVEAASPLRAAAWTRMSEAFASMGAVVVVHAPPADAPLTPPMRAFLYGRSKIVLHLHEAAATPLSARLVAQTAGAGALLLSEPCPADGLVRPGAHYGESSARRMPAQALRLLADPDAAQAAVAALNATLSAAFDPGLSGPAIVNALLDIAQADIAPPHVTQADL